MPAYSVMNNAKMASEEYSGVQISRSLIKFKHFVYKWTIDDFANLLLLTKFDLKTNKAGFKYVESDIFSHPNDEKVQFKIELYPAGEREQVKNYVSIFLDRVSSVDSSNDVYLKISILNVNNEECNVRHARYTFDDSGYWGVGDFISRDQLLNASNGFLVNGKMTLVVEINVVEDEAQICESQNKLAKNSPENFELTKVVKLDHFSYEWKIENFNFILNTKEAGTFMESPTFHSPKNAQTKFYLNLYPNGFSEECKGYLSLQLGLETCNQAEINVQSKFTVIYKSNEKLFCGEFMSNFTKGTEIGIGNFIAKKDFIRKTKELRLAEDTLTIICELQVFEDEFLCKETPKVAPIAPQVISILDNNNLNSSLNNNTNSKAFQDFSQLLESGEQSDVVFVLEGKEVRAHKALLASRSPVFSAMSRDSAKESNRIEIIDMKFEVFRNMLSYIYSGKYQPKYQNVADLFVAADKYDLQNLKDHCENSLCSMVNSETVVDLLTLADTFKADKLKTTLFDYINLQSPSLMKNEYFTNKISKQLVIELYNDMADKQNF